MFCTLCRNLNLCIKTEPVMARADATVYSITDTVASVPTGFYVAICLARRAPSPRFPLPRLITSEAAMGTKTTKVDIPPWKMAGPTS